MKFGNRKRTTLRAPRSSWERETALEFLTHFKNEPILWKRTYFSKHKLSVDEAWNRIAQKMSIDCTIEDLKFKKEALYRSYRNNALIRQFDPSYKPLWFAFELMDSFLKPKEDFNGDRTLKRKRGNPRNLKMPGTKFRRGQIETSEATNSDSTYISKQTNTSDTWADYEPDECELFARLLASKLRRLDEDKRDAAMHDINELMYKIVRQNSYYREDNVSNENNAETGDNYVTNSYAEDSNDNTNSVQTTDGNTGLEVEFKVETNDGCDGNDALLNVEFDGQEQYSENEIEYLEEHIDSDNSDDKYAAED